MVSPRKYFIAVSQPPPQALRFPHGRGERETSDWCWTARDHGKGTDGSLLPAFLCAHIFIKRETSGYEAGSITSLDGRARKEIEITGARLTDVTTVRRPDMNQLKFKYTLTQDKRFYMTAVGEHFDIWAHSRSEHMKGDSWRARLSDEGCLHEFKKGQRLWEVVQFGCDGCWGLGRKSYMCCVKLTEENTVRRDRRRKIWRRVLLDSGSQADRN